MAAGRSSGKISTKESDCDVGFQCQSTIVVSGYVCESWSRRIPRRPVPSPPPPSLAGAGSGLWLGVCVWRIGEPVLQPTATPAESDGPAAPGYARDAWRAAG